MAGPPAAPPTVHEPLLVAVLGPTGSGKTALALAIAAGQPAEIVSCDSVAVYRELEIGTAKPSAEERARVPHHLLDISTPKAHCTAGDYGRRAREVVRGIASRGRLPIIAGGTGLYLRATLDGLFAGPPRSEDLRRRLRSIAEKRGPERMHRLLARLDRAAAKSIHAHDTPKLIRALEVCLQSRRPITALWREREAQPLAGFRVLKLGLNPPRGALYDRLNARAQQMLAAGLVEEAASIATKYGEGIGPLNAAGYKQVMQYRHGALTREQLLPAIQQAHRNYAKRQMTWFRAEHDVHWLAGFGDDPAVQRAALIQVAANS